MSTGYTLPGVPTQDEGADVGFAGIMNFTGATINGCTFGSNPNLSGDCVLLQY